MSLARWPLAAALTWLAVAPAVSGEPFDGRWASDPAACISADGAASPVVVTSRSLSWPGAACTVGTSYRVGEAWHIGAHCLGEGMASNVAIRLTMRGEHLIIDWPRARPEELARCP
jgi:hypothetical protein